MHNKCNKMHNQLYCDSIGRDQSSKTEWNWTQKMNIAVLHHLSVFRFSYKPQKATESSVLTLLMPSPRKVMCVCLQPWPPFLPHTAGPWAPFFLTKTCRAPECSPDTLCLKDRHKSAAWAMWPNGRIRCAALPSLPLGSEMVRYCPPAVEKTVSWGVVWFFWHY